MMDAISMNQLFEVSYTPTVETQRSNNWTKNGHGKHLSEVYADACGVDRGDMYLEIEDYKHDLKGDYIVIHTKTGQEPKNFMSWQKVVDRIDMQVVQVGGKDDPKIKGAKDLRGLTINQTAKVIQDAKMFAGGDSICAHIAGYTMTDHLILFASTFSNLCLPITNRHPEGKSVTIAYLEPEDRHGCDRACHSAKCFRGVRSCMDNIKVKDVMDALINFKIPTKTPEPVKITGYTTTYNPDKYYPWRESIKSHLAFCDEVIVVDGGSTDGTLEELKEWKKNEPKLKVCKRRWKSDEPLMDGLQKA